MGYGFQLEVWGDYGLFSRPELKVERVSYDIITPSSARGILEAIYWHPGMKYVIDKIHIYNEPVFTNIRRNEVSEKIMASAMESLMNGNSKAKEFMVTSEVIQQRASLVLKNVRYVIEAHFDMTEQAGKDDTKEKFYNIALRRMRKGQFYHMPYMGCREFPANFRFIEGEIPISELKGTRDFGIMLYDLDYSDSEDIQAVFFRAIMKDGVVDLTNVELLR